MSTAVATAAAPKTRRALAPREAITCASAATISETQAERTRVSEMATVKAAAPRPATEGCLGRTLR